MTTINASSTIGIDLNPAIYTNPVVIEAGATISNRLNLAAVYTRLNLTTPFTIQNDGTIAGASIGVYLAPSGSVTNAASASITGGYEAIAIQGGAGIVANNGAIAGGFGVDLYGGGSVTNAASASISGTLTNPLQPGDGVFISGGSGTVVNAGSIDGVSAGIDLAAGGAVTNEASGSITGSLNGAVSIYGGGAGTVVNLGYISGGVELYPGGSVTNTTGASIVAGFGIIVGGGTGDVVNDGLISGHAISYGIPFGAGVRLIAGGSVTNAASGTISGDVNGVAIGSGTGTVVNDGSIVATGGRPDQGSGVEFYDSARGSVTNIASGSIIGSVYGVALGSGGTLSNGGTIIGDSGTAVVFGGTGSNLLVLDPGFDFASGVVSASSSASNTLELASAASPGTVTGLGIEFLHFGTIVFDAGAAWSIAGDQQGLAGTISGFAAGDTIELDGITVTGSSYANDVLTLTEASGAATLNLQGSFTTGEFVVRNVAGGVDVSVAAVPPTISGTVADQATTDHATIAPFANVTIADTNIGQTETVTITLSNAADGTLSNLGGFSATASPGVYTDTGSATAVTNAVDGLVFTPAAHQVLPGGTVATNFAINDTDTAGGAATDSTTSVIATAVEVPRRLVWTGASDTNFANAANWDDTTDGLDPATWAPNVTDTAGFPNIGGAITGTGSVAILSFDGGGGAWNLTSGAQLTTPGSVTVGADQVSALLINDGARIVGTGLGGAVIAMQSGAAGSSAHVTGTGSEWQIGGTLIVGDAGFGGLNVGAGGSVIAASLVAAAQSGGDGVISVSGTGSSLGLTGSLTVGAQGAGELSILGGATVSALDVTIGNASTLSSGNVDIEGAGSELLIGAGGVLNIGVAGGGSGVLSIGSGTTLSFSGTITESGRASFNNNGGLVDPDAVAYTTAVNSGLGENDYSLWVSNTNQVQIADGTGTFTTPMILSGTSVADALARITSNFGLNGIFGGVGMWQISSGGTLVINANTIDIGQAIVFEDTANDALVIGQVVNTDLPAVSGVPPAIAADAENLLQAGGFAAQIWNYQAGDQILFNNLTVASDIVSGNTVELFDASNTLLGSLTFFSKTGLPNLADATAAAAQLEPMCFCANTLIQTPSGEVPVQHLAVGDMVTTYCGAARRIVWIGAGKVLATRGRRSAATPVIVCKGALGENVPARDLRVTKGHSLYIDDVLIPVEFLVNHRSVLWDDRAQEVEIFHIELETHDVLLADGAPAESYRDDGNRWLFQNANSGWDLPPQSPCAPVLTGGPLVDAVWRRLLERAGARPSVPLTDDPDLHLLVDGERLDAASRHGTAYIFEVPARPSALRIVSRAAAPTELGLARDPRVLGVALRRLVVRRGTRFKLIEANDKRLAEGFHAFEADNGFRWTDGDAVIPTELFSGFTGPLELVLHIGGTTRYLTDHRARRDDLPDASATRARLRHEMEMPCGDSRSVVLEPSTIYR